ncbi:MAG TPA: LamG domain-containing protein [Polyangia bacterium]|nr:LamG domain-containing protein [Polyangia bacterium]
MAFRTTRVVLESRSYGHELLLVGSALVFIAGCSQGISKSGPTDADLVEKQDTSPNADTAIGSAGDVISNDGNGCVPVPAGLVAWWSGDDSLADRTGAHPLTAGGSGTFAFADGKVGRAFLLTGGAYIETPNSADLALDKGFTIEAWVYALSYGGRIVDHITAYSPDGYLLDTYASKVRGYAGHQGVSGSTTLTPGTWLHLATTFDPLTTTLSVYLNGVADGSATVSGTGLTCTNSLRLGADSSGGSLLNGIVDEVTLYDRPLTDSELMAIANAGAAGKCKQ